MNHKGSADMWWIIIGAVLALVVMIILMIMFTSKTQPLESGLSNCEGKGGVCVIGDQCPTRTLGTSAFDCQNSGEKCCLGNPKSCSSPNDCGQSNEYDCISGYCYSK